MLVSDSMKFTRSAPVRIGHLSDVDIFVTDTPPPPVVDSLPRVTVSAVSPFAIGCDGVAATGTHYAVTLERERVEFQGGGCNGGSAQPGAIGTGVSQRPVPIEADTSAAARRTVSSANPNR